MQYIIREQSSLLSREMSIEDHRGHQVFKAHGPVVRVRDELHVLDAQGDEQAYIKDPVLGDSSTFEIYRGGAHFADVKAVAVGNLLEGYDIVVRARGDEPFHARGDMFERDFTISHHGQQAARVRRQHGTALQVDTADGQDDLLLLAGVLAISGMTDLRARAASRQNT